MPARATKIEIDYMYMSRPSIRAFGRRSTWAFAKAWRDGVDPARHQMEMAKRADSDYLYQADFWPRDHGKSEIFCLSSLVRRVCEDPNIRILIVQKTATEAEKTLGVIKSELADNQSLKNYYQPHWAEVVGQQDISNPAGAVMNDEGKREGAWQRRRIYVKRTRRGKDPTVEAVGVGGAITGGHFDLIILDDVLDDENTKTDERCRNIINWFNGTILQLREPRTKIQIVGTLKTNRPNLYKTVIESPVWNTTVTSAIVSHPLSDIEFEPVMDQQGIITSVDVKTQDVKTMWPEKWDIGTLLLEMIASPSGRAIWIREKLNDLTALEGSIFKRDDFPRYTAEELAAAKPFDMVVQGWDTALEEGEQNDYSVCVTLGIKAGRAYVLHVWREKIDASKLLEKMETLQRMWGASAVAVEDVPGSKHLIQMAEQTYLPIIRMKPGGKDKTARARTVTVYTSAGRVLVPVSSLVDGADYAWVDVFLDEVAMFPESDYDDQADGFVYALLHAFLGDTVQGLVSEVAAEGQYDDFDVMGDLGIDDMGDFG